MSLEIMGSGGVGAVMYSGNFNCARTQRSDYSTRLMNSGGLTRGPQVVQSPSSMRRAAMPSAIQFPRYKA